ncbi:uncharacterized protein LOC111279916 [Durio zibethinus]|uniref:Uncharacterized protein LOC111279916 n=1 Tax=Durio zibethinus TaxID=66656 RepID=A0A6P5X4W0_DURZI|nr:uncharacterized protein LOC111279916 [Durio zibethinus]
MAAAQFHLSGRKALQPKNNTATPIDNVVVKQIKLKSKQEWRDDSNKENLNHHPIIMNPNATTPPKKKMEGALDLDSSLAEELSAIRKKLERLRLSKEKTEKILKDRDAMLHLQMKEMEERGRIQKQLEIEVDRLFRLKELKSYCLRISPIKSLRERQQGRKLNEVQSLEIKGADWEEESMDENTLQSPTPSDSSEFVGENND